MSPGLCQQTGKEEHRFDLLHFTIAIANLLPPLTPVPPRIAAPGFPRKNPGSEDEEIHWQRAGKAGGTPAAARTWGALPRRPAPTLPGSRLQNAGW